MLKKSITYTDLDNNKVTEEFYFHMSKAELTTMAIEEEGIAERLKKLADGGERREIIKAFNDIIRMSVGRRSEDGKRFIKDPDEAQAFMESEAYGELFMELFTDPVAAVEFVKAVIPGDISEKLADQLSDMQTVQLPSAEVTSVTTDLRPKERPVEDYTEDEIRNMPYPEFLEYDARIAMDYGRVPKELLVVIMRRRAAKI